ncbi:hypothetical protein [Cryptosporangium sp. NPDC051539]|uniref:hypothetical protein n=1 Tax=Cryptosporangium sp. NPDC051539 TaxID=3363962 RepID=UPI0037A00722
MSGAAPDGLNAIEEVSVRSGDTLRVRCRLPVPTSVDATALRIAGGANDPVRIRGVARSGPDQEAVRTLIVEVSGGDRSAYRFEVIEPLRHGFDPDLAAAVFTFGAGGHPPPREGPAASPPTHGPHVGYLARDYAGLRQTMLDRLSVLLPGRTDLSPADLGVTLVELFAYVGDQLSYAQDAVATEAYLATARRRISIRRHARLLDYPIQEGTAAQAWLVFTADASHTTIEVPAGTDVDSGSTLFSTLTPLRVRADRNALPVATTDPVPAGAHAVTLTTPAAAGLRRGDALVLDDGVRCWPVRLDRDPVPAPGGSRVRWTAADALPFPLAVAGAGAVAHANVVLAEHGAPVGPEPLVPPVVPAAGPYRPRLSRTGVAHGVAHGGPGSGSGGPDADRPVPRVVVRGDGRVWTVVPDLLDSDRFSYHCVVEVDDDGHALVRFGDGRYGRRPEPGTSFTAQYRLGGGTAGNVGAGVLAHLAATPPGLSVRNPLPANGGREPEPMEQVRRWAPVAHRDRRRAVTSADWAAAAERHPEVRRAVGSRRWTGSWFTEVVTVDRVAGHAADAGFLAGVEAFLQPFRLADVDLQVRPAIPVPLGIELLVRLTDPRSRRAVDAGLVEAFAAFFDPDALGLGEAVYLSRVVSTAMAVPGVSGVEWPRFGRLDRPAEPTAAAGRIPIGPAEVARCPSDPDRPERGSIDFRFVEARDVV